MWIVQAFVSSSFVKSIVDVGSQHTIAILVISFIPSFMEELRSSKQGRDC